MRKSTPRATGTPSASRHRLDAFLLALSASGMRDPEDVWLRLTTAIAAKDLTTARVPSALQDLSVRAPRGRRAGVAAGQVGTYAAVLLGVPVETWTTWIDGPRAHGCAWDNFVQDWASAWSSLRPAEWTPARIAQAADVLSATAPRVPAPFATRLAKEWADGTGDLADELAETVPRDVLQAIRARVIAGTPGRAGAAGTLVAPTTALTARADIRRLERVQWRKRSGPERCAMARRCDYAAKPQISLDSLVTRLVIGDRWTIPVLRALVEAQQTPSACAKVLGTIQAVSCYTDLADPDDEDTMDAVGDSTPMNVLLERDPVVLARAAHWLLTDDAAVRESKLVTLLVPAWHLLSAARWTAVATRLLQLGDEDVQTFVGGAVRAWWASTHDQPIVPPADLVAACLASRHAGLRRWALTDLVSPAPTTPAPTTPAPTASAPANAMTPPLASAVARLLGAALPRAARGARGTPQSRPTPGRSR